MNKKSGGAILLLAGIGLFSIVLSPGNARTAPKPEGELTAAVFSLAEQGFLPDRCSNTAAPLWESVYDFMIYSDSSTLKPIPGVAERWEYSGDYRSLTFHLRKGIQFHNGWGELTAEDVKFTINLNARPQSTNIISAVFRNITSMDVPDRYTLVIHLKQPDPMLWMNFCTADNVSFPILCKKYIETVGEETANVQPIGSGPYRLVNQKLGDYARFEALENHWLVVPEFKYLVVRVIPEESTRVAMLKTGEIDIAHNISLDKIPEIQKAQLKSVVRPNSQAMLFPFGGMLHREDKRYIEGYHRKDPWRDIRVREAMNIAIDREGIVKNLYRGTATAAPIWIPLPGWDKLKPIPYDPRRARQLLAESGYQNGFGFKIYADAKVPEMPMLAQAVAAYWEAIGLKPEIASGDYAAWRTLNKTGKTAGWVWTHALNTAPKWSERFTGYELPDASTPLWQSEETMGPARKFLVELDASKRDALLEELSQTYRSVYPHVPIAYVSMFHGAGRKVGEWSPGRGLHPKNFIFSRHAKPSNTFRLFSP